MQIHRTRPSPVRRADPVADLAREFDCPRVAGHPAHREQFQGRDGGLVRGGHNGAFGAPGQEDLPRCLRGGGRNRAHRSCASRRSWYLADCTRSMVGNPVTTPLGDTRGDLPNRDLRLATTPDRCCIRSASPGTESAREHRPASQPRCVRPTRRKRSPRQPPACRPQERRPAPAVARAIAYATRTEWTTQGFIGRDGATTRSRGSGAVCTCSGTRGCTCVPRRGRTRWRYVDDG